MVFLKEWQENLKVCPRCDFHDRIGPKDRFEQLFDAGVYELLPPPEVREDPLRFRDSKRYVDRLKTARVSTGERDALLNARGKIEGQAAIVGVQDFAFMAGSMGTAVGAALVAGVRSAIEERRPYILFTASGGARMQDGVTASYAMLGDVQVAEPGALIGFAGQRVIEQTIREKLPEGFQRAEYLLEHGVIDMVVPRSELKARLAQFIGYLAPEVEEAA